LKTCCYLQRFGRYHVVKMPAILEFNHHTPKTAESAHSMADFSRAISGINSGYWIMGLLSMYLNIREI
jgi:hypothetical protein